MALIVQNLNVWDFVKTPRFVSEIALRVCTKIGFILATL